MPPSNQNRNSIHHLEKQKIALEIKKLESENIELNKGRQRFLISSVMIPLLSTFGAVAIVWLSGILQAQGALNEAKSIEFGIKRDALHKENDSLKMQNTALRVQSDSLIRNFATNYKTVDEQIKLIRKYDSVITGRNIDLSR